MRSEAKATHSGMLLQFRTLWTKGMTVTTGRCVSLRLNDLRTLVEETFTPARGVWGETPPRPRLGGRKAKRRGLFQSASGRPRWRNWLKPEGSLNIHV